MNDVHLLQICNVGQITGGTAACAWSVTRALPTFRHTVAFLSTPTPEASSVFQPHRTLSWTKSLTELLNRIDPDLALLHNIASSESYAGFHIPTIQFIHSAGKRASADRTVFCSRWLSQTAGQAGKHVLWQGVPIPGQCSKRPLKGDQVRIGRICTPHPRKWPACLPDFYSVLAKRHPHVAWEFVGCPATMREPLRTACEGRVQFTDAGWMSRSRLSDWDALLYHHPDLTESFGRTVAEAARVGCIPIVDDRGGFSEQLQTLGLTGCRSVEQFSEAIDRLSCLLSRVELSRAIQKRADAEFSLRAFGHRLRTCIQDLVAS